ncbi:hypothetical protein JCGZ_13595 [Jatropha curcas]|uniref:Uncharacterized protein n=1 Tax=Jatropha curcas TaxID=180498 RepID=A0A067LQ16_JATCU|nr:hypothetical protein JCGZ_13595 [Jatropha curcas]
MARIRGEIRDPPMRPYFKTLNGYFIKEREFEPYYFFEGPYYCPLTKKLIPDFEILFDVKLSVEDREPLFKLQIDWEDNMATSLFDPCMITSQVEADPIIVIQPIQAPLQNWYLEEHVEQFTFLLPEPESESQAEPESESHLESSSVSSESYESSLSSLFELGDLFVELNVDADHGTFITDEKFQFSCYPLSNLNEFAGKTKNEKEKETKIMKEKINIGIENEPKHTFVVHECDCKQELTELIKQYSNCFTVNTQILRLKKPVFPDCKQSSRTGGHSESSPKVCQYGT